MQLHVHLHERLLHVLNVRGGIVDQPLVMAQVRAQTHDAVAGREAPAQQPLESGATTVLPFTIWMPRLDVVNQVTIPSPTRTETVITTPYIPGLELHLPARTV